MPEQSINLSAVIGLKPADAIRFFRSKGFAITWDWQQQLKVNHATTFTVSKAMRMDILQDIREMLQKALDDGITYQQFLEELEPRLRAKGWWGRREVTTETGKQVVQLGSPHRLALIYRQNTQSALNAGRFKAFLDNADKRPFLMYVAVRDDRTTAICKSLDGQVRPVGDPFWNTYAPPNHFGCRSRLRPLTAKQAEKFIKSGKGKIQFDGTPTAEGFDINPAEQSFLIDGSRYDRDIWEKGETLQP